jgi:hypothetical protein
VHQAGHHHYPDWYRCSLLPLCPLTNSKIGIQVKQNKGDWQKFVKEYAIMRHDTSNGGLTIAIGLQGGVQWSLELPSSAWRGEFDIRITPGQRGMVKICEGI